MLENSMDFTFDIDERHKFCKSHNYFSKRESSEGLCVVVKKK